MTHMTSGDFTVPKLLTPGQVSALFQVNPKTVTRWAASGRLASVRTPGGHRRFRESDVREFFKDWIVVTDGASALQPPTS